MKLILVLILLSSSAFADEKFLVKFQYALAKCTIGIDGEECKDPSYSEWEDVIELKNYIPYKQEGAVGLYEPTERGSFGFYVRIEKVGKYYSLFVRFIEPDLREFSSRNESFSPESGVSNSQFAGAPLILSHNRYLLPLVRVVSLIKIK